MKNSPSEMARAVGLSGLSEMARITGESRQTLGNWFNNEPRRFEIMLKGILFEKLMDRISQNLKATEK